MAGAPQRTGAPAHPTHLLTTGTTLPYLVIDEQPDGTATVRLMGGDELVKPQPLSDALLIAKELQKWTHLKLRHRQTS